MSDPIIIRLPEFSKRDWTEDFAHENGNYMCTCTVCAHRFYGHKRRFTCKTCTEDKVVDWWLYLRDDNTILADHQNCQMGLGYVSKVHIRFTNGVAGIFWQGKA